MGRIKEFITKTFIDTTDLDIANHEIGNLRDLCDSKDMVIAYQKELLAVQGESVKQMRRDLELLNELKKNMEELKNDENKKANTKRKSVRLPKDI